MRQVWRCREVAWTSPARFGILVLLLLLSDLFNAQTNDACEKDEECKEGKVCLSRQCVPEAVSCKSNDDCNPCYECVKATWEHGDAKICQERRSKCHDSSDCKGGRTCLTPAGSQTKECLYAPSACQKDDDCDKGRKCNRDRRFKEVEKSCQDQGSGLPHCKADKSCPIGYACSKQGLCERVSLKTCQRHSDCSGSDEQCLYDRAGLRVCTHEDCKDDKDCKEKKKCVRTKWNGHRCISLQNQCKSSNDCQDCESCVHRDDVPYSMCVKSGSDCKRNKDCKQDNLKCLRLNQDEHGHHKSKYHCLAAPFGCHRDDDCDAGRFCVLSDRFAHFHNCETLPRRCSDHGECHKFEECVETLIKGFHGLEWSSRCLTVPFKRCSDDKSCSHPGYRCVQHKAFGPVCICPHFFGTSCISDGDCVGEFVCDTLRGMCVNPEHCSSDADCMSGHECVNVRYFRYRSSRCLNLPKKCYSHADCNQEIGPVCRNFYRNGEEASETLYKSPLQSYGKRCQSPKLSADLYRRPVQLVYDASAKCTSWDSGSMASSGSQQSKYSDRDSRSRSRSRSSSESQSSRASSERSRSSGSESSRRSSESRRGRRQSSDRSRNSGESSDETRSDESSRTGEEESVETTTPLEPSDAAFIKELIFEKSIFTERAVPSNTSLAQTTPVANSSTIAAGVEGSNVTVAANVSANDTLGENSTALNNATTPAPPPSVNATTPIAKSVAKNRIFRRQKTVVKASGRASQHKPNNIGLGQNRSLKLKNDVKPIRIHVK